MADTQLPLAEWKVIVDYNDGRASGNNCTNRKPLGVFNVRQRRAVYGACALLNAGPRTKIIYVTSFVKAAMVTNEAIGSLGLLCEYFYRA
ncbi:Uncharacterized protein OBRU01_19603 [Operophtera brumata]|uniref:Uncharacterized protein n=1 Tax=Operophtera brumata TaxID=104452 RepID=A0A0L7KWM7_OPEBR|nr:Uncharacterized protein OBRU01_19603 [Operophtera brumata]